MLRLNLGRSYVEYCNKCEIAGQVVYSMYISLWNSLTAPSYLSLSPYPSSLAWLAHCLLHRPFPLGMPQLTDQVSHHPIGFLDQSGPRCLCSWALPFIWCGPNGRCYPGPNAKNAWLWFCLGYNWFWIRSGRLFSLAYRVRVVRWLKLYFCGWRLPPP